MDIKEINNKEAWEGFLLGCQEKTFLGSWNWGEFQKLEGNKIWRLGAYENKEIVAVALAIKIVAKRGTFLFVPHNPIVRSSAPYEKEPSSLRVFLVKLKEIAKEENCIFIRISPILEKSEENVKMFNEMGFKEAPIHMHPEATWELDISVSEEEILTGMRKTTRYLIRQAEKNPDIEIIVSKNINDLEKLNEIYSATAKRHKFVPFSLKYLRNQFSAFSADDEIMIFFGKYKGEIVSAAIFVFWQGIAFYHHSGSLLKFSKVPVSYLLQWEAIKEAKRRNCQLYNFWGIVDEKSKIKNHPWQGLTLFKIGFGGYKKEYVKTQDLLLSKIYWLTYIFEKLRKKKRGL